MPFELGLGHVLLVAGAILLVAGVDQALSWLLSLANTRPQGLSLLTFGVTTVILAGTLIYLIFGTITTLDALGLFLVGICVGLLYALSCTRHNNCDNRVEHHT